MSKSSFLALSALGLLAGQSQADTTWTCPELETTTELFYRMFPAYVAKAYPNDEHSQSLKQLQGHCFNAIDIMTSFSYLDEAQTQLRAEITLGLWAKEKAFCLEHLQISTAFSDHYNFYGKMGTKTFTIDFTDLEEVIDIHTDGLKFFTYCADSFDLLSSSIETAFLWLGGSGYTSNHIPVFGSRPTDYQQDGNSDYLKSFTGMWLEDRVIDQVFFDYDLMQTGDILVGRRFTGLTAQQMLFSGSFASHVAMVVRDDDDTLYVLECREDWTTDKRTGVMKTKLDDWVPAAYQAGYEFAWLPLERKGLDYINSNRDNLNDWFSSVEGKIYSPVKDFLASFDHSYQGLPAPFNSEALPIYLRMWHKRHKLLGFTHFWNEFIEAMGLRFQLLKDDVRFSKHQLPQTFNEAVKYSAIDLNMSIQELLAIPEKDEWRYDTNHGEETFTPSSFVIQALQQLKVLDRYKINSSEFTVKDVYELNLFDQHFPIPDQCMEADHKLPYCQLFGKYRLHLPNYSYLDPYDHMNETCPNKFENQWRPALC